MTRICLDLNVWCAAFLADRAGRQGTACQTLVEVARSAQVGREPLQLVISWGMLERLKLVLEPGGAAGLAAILSHKIGLEPTARVGIILSGGNVDLARFCGLLAGQDG